MLTAVLKRSSTYHHIYNNIHFFISYVTQDLQKCGKYVNLYYKCWSISVV